jgi:hypothetical protein
LVGLLPCKDVVCVCEREREREREREQERAREKERESARAERERKRERYLEGAERIRIIHGEHVVRALACHILKSRYLVTLPIIMYSKVRTLGIIKKSSVLK